MRDIWKMSRSAPLQILLPEIIRNTNWNGQLWKDNYILPHKEKLMVKS